jgi:cation transport ATPase
VAFDKTGTLTRGLPEVVDVVALNGVPPDGIVALAAAVEHRSEHPIAHAVLRYAEASHIVAAPASDVAALAGLGAEGRVAGAPVLLGNHRLFEERGLCSPRFTRTRSHRRRRTDTSLPRGGKRSGSLDRRSCSRDEPRRMIDRLAVTAWNRS